MSIPDSIDGIQVLWQVDNIDVHATLTRPIGMGPFPAVAMVAGSGPNAQANIQRMLGKVSMKGHLEELAGGVRLLANRQDVDPKRLFALTNSEGCIHALNHQLQAKDFPFAGLILTGAPARSVGEVARSQIAAQLAAVAGGDALLAAYDAAMADFTAERPVKVDESLPEPLRNMIQSVIAPHHQPFSRELWAMNPATLAADITAPVLILIGKKDLQVDWQADGSLWETLAKDHSNFTLAYPDNANHVLKYEPKPRAQLAAAEAITTYNAEGAVLDPQVIETIVAWLNDHHFQSGAHQII